MKKVFLVLIVLLILSMALTACGKTDTPKDGSTGQSQNVSKGQGEESVSSSLDNVTKTFMDFIQNGDYSKAVEHYQNNILGNYLNETSAYEQILALCNDIDQKTLSGEYDEGTVKAKLGVIEKVVDGIDVKTTEYTNVVESIANSLASKVAYQSGLAFLESGSYLSAIKEFEKVLPNDSNYRDATEKSEQAMESYANDVLTQVDKLIVSGEATDYLSAINLLKPAIEALPSNVTLAVKLNVCEEGYISKIISDADAIFTDYFKYEDALAVIRSGLQSYPQDESLINKRDYFSAFAPVNLYDVEYVKTYGEPTKYESSTDTYHNTYSKCFRVRYRDKTSFSYDLKKQYNNFTMTVYGYSSDTDAGIYSITIYGDNIKLYENLKVLDNGKPFDVSINITGISELTFEIKGNGMNPDGVGFTNVIVQKTVK